MDTSSSALVVAALGLFSAIVTVVGFVLYKAVMIFADYFFKNPRLPGGK